MKKMLIVIGLLFIPVLASAWDGYDYESGSYIEIDKGNLVRSGEDIEIYDYETDYREVTVESVYGYGGSVEIEVYDGDSGEHRTFEME